MSNNYFKKQLKNKNNIITEDKIKQLKSKSIYESEYEVNDRILYFIEYVESFVDNSPKIHLAIKIVLEKELPKFYNEYEYVDMPNTIPVFKKK